MRHFGAALSRVIFSGRTGARLSGDSGLPKITVPVASARRFGGYGVVERGEDATHAPDLAFPGKSYAALRNALSTIILGLPVCGRVVAHGAGPCLPTPRPLMRPE